MFERLKQKWKVGPLQLVLILSTFAIGGSLSGYAGRWLLAFFPISGRALYLIIYIVVVALIWPLAVLLVSIFFGQFRFFRQYLQQLWKKIKGNRSRISLILPFVAGMNINV